MSSQNEIFNRNKYRKYVENIEFPEISENSTDFNINNCYKNYNFNSLSPTPQNRNQFREPKIIRSKNLLSPLKTPSMRDDSPPMFINENDDKEHRSKEPLINKLIEK